MKKKIIVVCAFIILIFGYLFVRNEYQKKREAEIGDSIKNAMSNPDGVPIGEVIDNFSESLSEQAEKIENYADELSENINTQKETNINDNGIEVLGEYFYMRGNDSARYFLVLKNNSISDKSIDISVVARDIDGNPLGVENEKINAISNGQELLKEFYFNEVENVSYFDYSIDEKDSDYVKSDYENISYDTFINGSKLIVTIKNNGNEVIEHVSAHAIFFNNGQIFSHEYSGYEEIEVSKEKNIELDCFDGEFEDFKVYIEAWSFD